MLVYATYVHVIEMSFKHITNILGAQWLSGRVHDSRKRDCGFKPHRHYCVVSMNKTH